VNDLCRGPGNLTRALGITLKGNRLDLTGSKLRIEERGLHAGRDVEWSPRIGINVGTEHHWRCVDANSPAVSGRNGRARRRSTAG
jgi:3-methyladenine DNA glycosylase Mpg